MTDNPLSYNVISLRRMMENFGDSLEVATVSELSERGVIFVEDGNHGENRPRQDEFAAVGVPFLRPPDLINGRVDFENCGRINEAGFRRVRKGIGRRGDIILTHRATVGRIAITDNDAPDVFVTNPGTTIWRSTNPQTLDQRYLYCYMRSAAFMDQLWSQVGNNCTFDYVSLTQQRGLRVAYPPLREQEAIAAILGVLDDKIELNRRMNAALEEMARALFQSWFVDFDPVRAKQERGAPAGIDEATAAIFPDQFHDSELGPIPTGWRVSKLNELTSKIGSGATPRGGKEVYVSEGPALIRSQNVYDHEFWWEGLARLTEKSANELKNVEVQTGDILFNITGDSILRTCVVDPSVLPARVNQHVAIIRALPGIPSRYLHLFLVQPSVKSQLFGLSAGATRHAITKGHLEGVAVPRPPEKLLAAFETLTRPWFEQIDCNRIQSRTLAALRDTLLPKLLSGELCVAGFR